MALPALLPGGNLATYLREIHNFPILTAEEEYMLAKRWTDHQDMAAAHRMVTSHLRLVVKIAAGFRGYGLPFAEMISEGSIGLMQAVKRFDPERGFRLSTYAIWWIKAAIQEYVLKSWSLVKVGTSGAQKKLFFNLKRIKNRLQAFDHTDLSKEAVAEIAHELGVNEDEVVAMDRRMIAYDQALDAPVAHESDSTHVDFLADDGDSQESLLLESEEYSHRKVLFDAAMGTLNAREQDILHARKLQDPAATLEELSQKHGISRERVRQIEASAMDKLQKAIAGAVASS
ncbi:MAG: RNA polymerase sigma factor RpoH [Alphaproteobacteria bacterium]|nr:RNA polymerase sigma factor RpoH [Alphaproteobacteria bacterium]